MHRWISVQLGSREHYAVPRALMRTGRLERLYVDAWVSPRWQTWLRLSDQRSLGERFHQELQAATVSSFTARRISFELSSVVARKRGWNAIISRNEWFQNCVSRRLEAEVATASFTRTVRAVFAYSYAARKIFRLLKPEGVLTVLGQIDPGPYEEEYVNEHTAQYQDMALDPVGPPKSYWDSWRQECELADTIVVNSEWSKRCLSRSGIPVEKVRVLPLAFDSAKAPALGREVRFRQFSGNSPLTVLFLGQIILRKGVGQIFDAIKLLAGAPVRFVFAGPLGVVVPNSIRSLPNVRFEGAVPRSVTKRLYQQADLFLLPTLSDGFAITQLEALANGVPCIVSKNCGEVVKNGINGIVLETVSAERIAQALHRCLENPALLASMQSRCEIDHRFSIDALADNLASLQ